MTGRYRQGDRQQKRRAGAFLGPQNYLTLQAVHGLVNYRKSHAAAGQAIDGVGGGETSSKNDARQLFGGMISRLNLGKHVGHLFQIYSTAIVFHFYDQASSLGVQA